MTTNDDISESLHHISPMYQVRFNELVDSHFAKAQPGHIAFSPRVRRACLQVYLN